MYLDELPVMEYEVGYGQVGRGGHLGYEGRQVEIGGEIPYHALSAHAPSRLLFALQCRFVHFTCSVALNEDTASQGCAADFCVLADGRPVAAAQVQAGDPPLQLQADLHGVRCLELVVRPQRWEGCHTVWLDPQVEPIEPWETPVFVDCLARVQVPLPSSLPPVERCIATVVSPGYTALLDDFLGSLTANGECNEVLVVVFAIDADAECRRVIAKHGAVIIEATALSRKNQTLKAVMYSVAHIVQAQYFLCLDADMLVLGDLRPVFSALEVAKPGSILVCRDAYLRPGDLLYHLCNFYRGTPEDLDLLLGKPTAEGAYPLVVNDGFFAGSWKALMDLDCAIRKMMPQAASWTDANPEWGWRNQFIFNLALAKLDCGVEVRETWNYQLHMWQAQFLLVEGRLQAYGDGHPIRIAHFVGHAKVVYEVCRNIYARIYVPFTKDKASDAGGQLE